MAQIHCYHVSKCLNDNQYSSRISNEYNKENKRKNFKNDKEIISILHFVKSTSDILTWFLEICQSHNTTIYNILSHIDHLDDNHIGDISISIDDSPGVCVVSSQTIKHPRLLKIKNKYFPLHVKYISTIKAFYTIRFCYFYLTIIFENNMREINTLHSTGYISTRYDKFHYLLFFRLL